MKYKIILVSVLAITLLVIGSRFIYYGSVTKSCSYSEKEIPIPTNLHNGTLVLTQTSYLAVGKDKNYSCLDKLGNIDREILNPAIMNSMYGVMDSLKSHGLKINSLEKDTSFELVKILEGKPRGLSSFIGDSTPSYYLILKDKDNTLYKIETMSLGQEDEELLIAFIGTDSNQSDNQDYEVFLGTKSFHEKSHYEFSFTRFIQKGERDSSVMPD